MCVFFFFFITRSCWFSLPEKTVNVLIVPLWMLWHKIVHSFGFLSSLLSYCVLIEWGCLGWSRIYALLNRVSIGSENGLSPVWRQAITRTNTGLLLIRLLETNFSEIWIGIISFSFKKIHLKMLSAKMAAILSRGDELTNCGLVMPYGDLELGQHWFR